ncbi:MAG: SNF2 helicase associated domain-containing protein [Bacteroidetes bacterium]|nr:SNF2 helicase associated domain-containing protein [Bacteroidota bacterium]
MSLPPILRYVYNHGTEEVVRRGKKIFYTAGVQMLDVDHLLEQVRFRVRNDIYQNYYTVTVNKYLDPKNMSVRCQCPYNMGDICRHEVAALFQLNDVLQSGYFENADIEYDQKHSLVRMRQVTMQMIRVFASPQMIEQAIEWANAGKAIILKGKGDRIEAEVPDGEQTYKVVLKQNEERYYDTSCGCNEKKYPLCVHKATLFIQILKQFGQQYFQTARDWDEQKNKLLGLYGYSLNDDLTGKFEFIYQDGKPFLRVLDQTIKKVPRVAEAPQPSSKPLPKPVVQEVVEFEDQKRLGIVLDPHVKWYPFVNVMLVLGETDEERKKYLNGVERLDLQGYINPMQFREEERELLPIARKFMPEETMRFLKKNLPFGDFLDDYNEVLKEKPSEEVTEQVWEYLLPKYQKLLERYKGHTLCFINSNAAKFSSKDLEPVAFSSQRVLPQLSVRKDVEGYIIDLSWIIDDKYVPFNDVEVLNAGLIMHEYNIHAMASTSQVSLIEKFLPDGEMKISGAEWASFLNDTLMQWSQMVHVNFGDELVETIEKTKPIYRLYLQERDQILVLQPAFSYSGVEIKWGFFGDVIEPHEGVVKVIKRSEADEQEYINMLRSLHTDIQQNIKDHFFYLPATSVLANNWFFRFAEVMKEWNVELFGYDNLKNLRISTYKPETRVHVSSGIDWFDATVELVFGDQKVSLIEVKKALGAKQNFVKLDDGSLGLLPEEWIKKYALLIKMGENKGGKIRLKRYHFSILDELMAEVDEEELQKELEEKKERLVDIIENDYSNMKPPAQLKATLRPYQQAGFQWLLFLQEAGWGGILADDMGLGKTVQALTLFQHYKNENPEAKFLVVCPTTLMYNWENEIKKFTPELTHFIHHGPKRLATQKAFDPYDIIITTYGTMRSDIKVFKDIFFDYAVLDESQSIKNPQSQVAKASLLLHSKHRLALSGTPVQNNTFDLFAQMNFLNPGMLGSREFFMNEFATPIDKFQEDEVKQQLRKLTYPFLLRRTKEQVAKDLPEKTETILYCEMGDEQRKIYDVYRNTYREQIMGMIEERGVERSTMHILQGLTRLRQICDSPAILNEAERFHNCSIKLDELTREITENVGDHKALIFSQFLGMLDLIRKELEARNIPYVYFDGSSTATQRETAIQEFQNNHECRVFLISLKAGGIGLNLTAADYVYIVDPWWNPAVEQQAIDRTHRIGQTKNIFAYRLICKDTIEEKMLVLQERKRALASELVSDDNAFLKRLTKEDIAYLLS